MTKGIKSNLAIPDKNITGKNTITVVNVDTNIGEATSVAAARVACILLTPSLCIRV